jgi:hypothetical protein
VGYGDKRFVEQALWIGAAPVRGIRPLVQDKKQEPRLAVLRQGRRGIYYVL